MQTHIIIVITSVAVFYNHNNFCLKKTSC